MATVYLALGANVGDCKKSIAQAVQYLEKSVTNIRVAPLYVTKAVGYTDQPDFFNTVLVGQTSLSPEELLVFVKGIEKKVGRVFRFRWGPREIDIDIILYDDLVLDTPTLTIPHPRFSERDFVLKPLSDLAPDVVDPRSKKTIHKLLQQLPADQLSVIAKE